MYHILVTVVPPTLPPTKPTKILEIRAHIVLSAWCFSAVLLIPVFFFCTSDYTAQDILIGVPAYFTVVYLVTFLAALAKNAYAVQILRNLMRYSNVFCCVVLIICIAMSSIVHLVQNQNKRSVDNFVEMVKLGYQCIIPLAFDIITVTMMPRAIEDMKQPIPRSASEHIELAIFFVYQ